MLLFRVTTTTPSPDGAFIMPWIRTLAVIFTLFSTAALAQPVIKDGKEWLQPADFVNLSWDDVAVVCDPVTGLCDGTLKTVDVTGYTWASVDEVSGLFNSYGVSPPLSGADTVSQAGSSWAPSFLQHFPPTAVFPGLMSVRGWARTRPSGEAYVPFVTDSFPDASPDDARTSLTSPVTFSRRDLGVWLYRSRPIAGPAPVPTVPTYVLIFTVLGLLAIATRRLSRRNAREG